MAMLGLDRPTGGVTAAITDPVDFANNRCAGITETNEIFVQRMRGAVFHGTNGCNQGLADHLSSEYTLSSDLQTVASEEVVFKRFEVENVEQAFSGVDHAG